MIYRTVTDKPHAGEGLLCTCQSRRGHNSLSESQAGQGQVYGSFGTQEVQTPQEGFRRDEQTDRQSWRPCAEWGSFGRG